jgi:mannose/cellobiose epimerase-like protein (N-acyl-D-glucosamine 2-epimerase family)
MTRLAPRTTLVAVPPEPAAERLLHEADRLIGFARGSVLPTGGFALLDDAGAPRVDEPVHTWQTCRMTHVFAIAALLGDDEAPALVDHGLRALEGLLRDAEHGGWYASVDADGHPVASTKESYSHAFVVLAAASATVLGRPGARELLDEALAVMDQRFWDDERGAVSDVWDRAWTDLEPYRGANANMHWVEALLAASDATGDERWRQRALRATELLVHGQAREHGWRLPEHYDVSWQPLPEYNSDDRAHAFRPFGVTPGHLLEWSRLCLHLRAALGDAAPDWLLDDARALFATAVRDGWAVDGQDGFVYTVDFDGAPVVRQRMHWVVAEGIGAAAALARATGEDEYDEWYRRLWAYADRHLLDRENGSWHHELDPQNQPSSGTWSGKPDVYHALQATVIPLLPLSPTLVAALARG